MSQHCPGVISEAVAHKSEHIDNEGNVICPNCGESTYPSGERKVVEVHAKLCTDETIHYPAMRKAGTITEEKFQS
jgi:phage terminase large subunit GpA-like protein